MATVQMHSYRICSNYDCYLPVTADTEMSLLIITNVTGFPRFWGMVRMRIETRAVSTRPFFVALWPGIEARWTVSVTNKEYTEICGSCQC